MTQPVDAAAVLDRLKGFQRDTVEYAFQRLFLDEDSSHRFLVADEVGLGKTLVARGVVAKTIEHLHDRVARIDVIYICSNANIARQNMNRLNVLQRDTTGIASRITLLPLFVRDLDAHKVNLIGLTPSTSFEMTEGTGVMKERLLVYWLLREAWDFGRSTGPKNLFQVGAGKQRFRSALKAFPTSGPDGGPPYDRSIAQAFVEQLEASIAEDRRLGRPDLRSRFEELREVFGYARTRVPKQDRRLRDAFIGDLRTLLARTCLAILEPDLVILDEFQRFRDLLDGDHPAARLAQDLFRFADGSNRVRVLLLSATPYKMYTLSHEQEENDHYQDFLRTVRFLQGASAEQSDLRSLLDRYRHELYALGHGGGEDLEKVKSEIEAQLRRVMARTERIRVSEAGDGMLREVPSEGLRLEPADVRSFAQLQRLARELDEPDVVEYWKSAPYLLNFMDAYKLKQVFLESIERARKNGIRRILGSSGDLLLSGDDIERYREVDPRSARLRSFLEDLLANESWRALWLPPTAPCYRLEGPFRILADAGFTKRLVFSSWTVVPRVVATLASYEAERRIFRRFEPEPLNTQEARERRSALLTFTQSEGRLTGMPALGILYPSSALAEAGDALTLSLAAGPLATLEEVRAAIEQRLEPSLAALTRAAPTGGAEDEGWYWAVPILLDLARDPAAARAWWAREDLPQRWAGGGVGAEADGWAEHVERARQLVAGRLRLGRPPSDLARVASLLAVGGPATAALRSFARLAGDVALLGDPVVRDAAARTGWAFRSLFNQPEATAILRVGATDTPYWLRVLEYASEGCIQALLDEYVHLLRESEGLFDASGSRLAEELANVMAEVIGLRTSTIRSDEFRLGDRIERVDRRLRTRFAMRFGREKSESSLKESDVVREDLVRAAFNSPFWPFALVTTSMGQEGLDFHTYCHAVVHWNLPANPVDLEQREGRVHRFKGHAIRKNVARRFAEAALGRSGGNPWDAMFDIAAASGNGADRGLSPYWMFPLQDGAFIERHVPNLPLSRDVQHLENLRRSLAVYRMVFGQPRQDDLMAFLLERVEPAVLEQRKASLRVDLSPPANHGAADRPGRSA